MNSYLGSRKPSAAVAKPRAKAKSRTKSQFRPRPNKECPPPPVCPSHVSHVSHVSLRYGGWNSPSYLLFFLSYFSFSSFFRVSGSMLRARSVRTGLAQRAESRDSGARRTHGVSTPGITSFHRSSRLWGDHLGFTGPHGARARRRRTKSVTHTHLPVVTRGKKLSCACDFFYSIAFTIMLLLFNCVCPRLVFFFKRTPNNFLSSS